MKLDEAVKLLEPLQGKSAANILMRYSMGTVKSAIRTIYDRESSTQDNIAIASNVEAVILSHQYNS